MGSLPGFHSNLVLSFFDDISLFQVVLGSLFTSIIPALLMVPIGEMAPVLLLGQEATKKGKMQIAISEFSSGAFFGGILFFLLLPIYSFFIQISDILLKLTPYFLVFTVVLTLMKSLSTKKALFVFLVSGVYGYIILNFGLDSNLVLGAHFSSMFGLVGLFLSEKIPKQTILKPKVSFDFVPSFVGTIGGLLISLFPAITPAQVYVVLLLVFGVGARGLYAAGALTISSFLFSFQSLVVFGKGRMASVEVIKYLPYGNLVFYLVFSYVFLIFFSQAITKLINYIPNLREVMLVGLLLLCYVVYGNVGLIVVFSFLLGFLPLLLGVERVHLMGSLLLPTILYYIF
ncbi:MAG: hypothetical protein GOU98_04940 [Candidatus Altiarchaeota archaeon]|nr:hypothetical protein [Candidatus Altiarchaeota archaeon]